MNEAGQKLILNSFNSIAHFVILSNKSGLWSLCLNEKVVNTMIEWAKKYALKWR